MHEWLDSTRNFHDRTSARPGTRSRMGTASRPHGATRRAGPGPRRACRWNRPLRARGAMARPLLPRRDAGVVAGDAVSIGERTMTRKLIGTLAAMMLMTAPLQAQSVQRGLNIARTNCVMCHA